MSPLWNRRSYKLYLAPHALNWVQVSNWGNKVLEKGLVTLNPTLQPDLSAALRTLPEILPVSDLIISDAWLRYLVLVWPQGINTKEELQAYIEGGFADVYGGERWQLLWQAAAPGNRILVCGIPQVLTNVFDTTWPTQKPDIRPLFSTVLQALPGKLRRGLQQILVLESSHLTFGLSQDQDWCSITSLDGKNQESSLLQARIRQEQAAQGFAQTTPLHCLANDPQLTQWKQSGWNVHNLRAYLPACLAQLLQMESQA